MKFTKEHRRNISESKKCFYAENPDSHPNLGLKMSNEQKKKISESLKRYFAENPSKKPWGNSYTKGRKHSTESKEKMSKAIRKYIDGNREEAFRVRSKAHKGQIPWTAGKHLPEEIKKKISEGNKRYMKEHPEDKRWIGRHYKHTPESLNRIRKGVATAILEGRMDNASPRRFIKGNYYSKKNGKTYHYRSSYELCAFKLLESMHMVCGYEYEPFHIRYVDENGELRRYIPDIMVRLKNGDKELIEVRPNRYLNDVRTRKKFKAANRFCKKHDMTFRVWTEDQVFKHKIREPVRELSIVRTPVRFLRTPIRLS